MKITQKLLLDNGFKQIMVKNPNDESDHKMLMLFKKNEIAVGFNGMCWDVYNMGFDIPTITGTVLTWEEIKDGMNNVGLALDWKK